MAKQTMGEFLSILRKAAGFTQQDIAEKLGISAKTVSSWETDRTCPDLSLLPILADIYGVTCDELLRGERDRTPPEEENEEIKAKRTEQEAKTTEALLKKNLADYTGRIILAFGLSGGCSAFYALTSYYARYRLLSIILLMGFLSCSYLMQYLFYKAFTFCSSDPLGLRYRKTITDTYFTYCQRRYCFFTSVLYITVSYTLIRNIIRFYGVDQLVPDSKKLIGSLILILAIRFLSFYIHECAYDSTLFYCIDPADTVHFRQKRRLVYKRFFTMQTIVSALCLIPVALYLVGVIRLHLHFAMLAPVILLLQKIPIHLYYAEGRGIKHIVLPEEAPIKQEKSA